MAGNLRPMPKSDALMLFVYALSGGGSGPAIGFCER